MGVFEETFDAITDIDILQRTPPRPMVFANQPRTVTPPPPRGQGYGLNGPGYNENYSDPSRWINHAVDHPDYKQYGGMLPLDGIIQAAQDYRKYVLEQGKTIPPELWMGTAYKETTFGKAQNNANSWGMYMAHPDQQWLVKNANSALDPKIAFAADKLQQGLDKFKGNVGRAARWYNWNEGPKRSESVLYLGRSILSNPRVRSIWKNETRM